MAGCLKIYIVDDAMELCRELRGWLSDSGHEVTCSPAGRTLLHTLTEFQPDLIVFGLTRYGGEGMELYRRFHNHRYLRQVPMIVASDDASLEYEMLDAFDFQVRPFDRKRLQTCLERLSGSRRSLSKISFAEPDLTPFKSFLREHSGLHFSQHNLRIMERGLVRRVQALCMESLTDYLQYLTATSDNYDEMNKLLGLLTVGETSFFRYRSHREALLHYVTPRLIQLNKSNRTLRIWSAGCSSGEEPYSLAILLHENFPELADWNVRILATDINKRSLRQAREGLYGERSLRMVEDSLKQRYFEKVGNHFILSERVKQMVKFDYLNLQTDHFPAQINPGGKIDLLLCRNVLIYFELETIRQIVSRFSQVLRPHGYLFMGHSETMQNVSDRFKRHHQNNAFFYQLKDDSVKAKDVATRMSRENACPVETSPPPVKKAQSNTVPVPASKESGSEQSIKSLRCDPDQLYRDAVAAFDHEKFAEATKLFDQLLEQQPADPKALVGRGLLMANQGNYSDARICCARAIKENDLLPEAYLLRGLILDMEGHLKRALVEYQKVLWLDPAFVMAHYLTAKIHDRLADQEKRQRSLKNTLRALEQNADPSSVPFSGGLSRSVFLEIVRKELSDTPAC